ncbi:MAG TPA: right-handed parallel beta-helix repeat-containing protein [Phycisphaerae bacterium]|nr:right-handed parallel beta-helix repeat-containing protein [Phycisphaerae bacterium]
MQSKQVVLAFIAVFVLLVPAPCCAAAAEDTKADFYVAPDGSDENAGTIDKPFASLARAKDAVRKLRAADRARYAPLEPHIHLGLRLGEVVVMFRGGFYEMKDTVLFEPQDSGTKDSPTIYRAYPGEKPVLSGGRKITGWKMDAKGRWTVSLPETKVTQPDPTCSELWDAHLAKKTLKLPSDGKWEFSQLFVNDERRFRPRCPEEGYHKIPSPGPSDEFGAKFPGEGPNAVAGGAAKAEWRNLNDVEFIIMNGWNTGRYRISAVKGGTFWITGPGAGGAWWNGIIANRRYFLVNMFDLMKAGQFYLDRKAGVLIYHPKQGETPEKCTVIAPRVGRLVELKGDIKGKRWVQYIEFHGLTFAHANWNLVRGLPKGGRGLPQAELDVDAAVKATGMYNCTFRDCTIRNVGQYALRIDMACKHNVVEDCEFIDMGGGGLWLGSTHNGGWGFHDDLPEGVEFSDEMAASHNKIRNCLVANVGRLHGGSVGIWIGQAHNNLIEHCEVFDTYYSGMNHGWRWGYGQAQNHDNTIQFNYIHHVGQGVLQDMGAIYTLGTSKGTVFRNNVLADIWSYRNNQGCGFYNDQGSEFLTFENNLVVNANDGAYHNHQSRNITLNNNIFALNNGTIKMTISGPFTFTHNIVYWKQGYLTKGNAKVDMHHNLWSRGGPKGDRDSIVADPMFVDPDKRDFHLKPGSPAEKIGFKPFDYTKAGRLEGFRKAADLPAVQKINY